jgi:hypothetical protein
VPEKKASIGVKLGNGGKYIITSFALTMCYIHTPTINTCPRAEKRIAPPSPARKVKSSEPSARKRLGRVCMYSNYEPGTSSFTVQKQTPTPRHPEDSLYPNIPHLLIRHKTKRYSTPTLTHSHPTSQPHQNSHIQNLQLHPAPAIMKPTLLALILAAISSTSVTSAAPIPQDPINDLVCKRRYILRTHK